MSYNSPYTGAQIDSVMNSVINHSGVLSSESPQSASIQDTDVITWGFLRSLFPLSANNGGTGSDYLKIHPIGFIFEWSNKKADGTTITNAPDLTTASAVANYFGYGTWELYGIGKVTVGINTSDSDFNATSKTGGAKGAWSHSHGAWQDGHSHTYTDSKPRVQSKGASGSTYYTGLEVITQTTSWSQPTVYTSANPASSSTDNNLSATKANMPPYITVYRWIRVA